VRRWHIVRHLFEKMRTTSHRISGAVCTLMVAACVLQGVSPSVSALTISQPPSRLPEPGPPLPDGHVYSFGVVGGDGKILKLERRVPTPVAGLPSDIVQVASSNSDSYALSASGTVWAWGAGGLGELGNGTTPRSVNAPVEAASPLASGSHR
jgi:hypothetical protein